MKRKMRYLAMLLMSTSMVLSACGGGTANSSASQSASAEASAESAEDAAKKAEEEAAKKAEEEAKAAAEASRLAEEEAKKKAEEEAKAAEEALKKELEEYGIEAVEEGILVEIAAACAEEDYETAWELMHGEDYEASAKELEASGNDRVIVQTPHGRIGMYHVDADARDFIGDYLLYFGDYIGDRREGHGIWLSVDYMETYETPEYSYVAACEWKDDRPADGAVHIETILPTGFTTSEDGTLAGGFFDGDRMHSYVNSSGEESSRTEVYNNGYMVISGVVLEPNAKLPAKEKTTLDNGQTDNIYVFSDGTIELASYIDSIIGRRFSILGFSEQP